MVTADEAFLQSAVVAGTGLLNFEAALPGFATYQTGLAGSLRHDVAILLTHRPSTTPPVVLLSYLGTACVPSLSAAIVNVGHDFDDYVTSQLPTPNCLVLPTAGPVVIVN